MAPAREGDRDSEGTKRPQHSQHRRETWRQNHCEKKKKLRNIATATPHNNHLIPLLAYKQHEATAQREKREHALLLYLPTKSTRQWRSAQKKELRH
jgi:hypothetical protein